MTRDSDTTFKVKRSTVNLQRAGHIVAASRTACYFQQRARIYEVESTVCIPMPRKGVTQTKI